MDKLNNYSCLSMEDLTIAKGGEFPFQHNSSHLLLGDNGLGAINDPSKYSIYWP